MATDSSVRSGDGWRSRWVEAEARACASPLALRAYGSRLLGGDPDLVMLGGGNTSLKGRWPDAAPDAADCLWVKGTGSDLALVVERDFTPVDLAAARRLLDGPDLDNDGLARGLAPLVLAPGAPRPSIETLMHASLPFRHVEHTHADSILAVLNTADGAALAGRIFGRPAPLVPFLPSGFGLARACRDVFAREAGPDTIGLLLAFHGVVAFADDPRESYERMGALVARAEAWLRAHDAWSLPRATPVPFGPDEAIALARLRLDWSRVAGFPVVTRVDDSPEALAFARRADLDPIALQGPPTPQHAVFTKRLPCIGRDLDDYAARYRDYLAAHGNEFAPETHPDPAPRVVLDARLGVIAASVDGALARSTAEVYAHDIAIISRASALDRYVSLPPADVLAAEIHYGGFDRRRLARRATDLPLLGCVILLTGVTTPDATAVTAALTEAGATVRTAGRADDAAAIAAARDGGGIDALLHATGPASVTPLVETLLALSPRGGCRLATIEPAHAVAALANHWNRIPTA